MKITRRRTPAEVQRDGFRALIERLGPADALRFVRHYEPGQGDYVQERRKLFENETASSLVAQVRAGRKRKKCK